MRRLSLLIGGFISACWLISACGSDTPAAPVGAAGAGGSGGAAANCVGFYSDVTSAAFMAAVTPGLGCSSSADANLICSNDVTTITGTCGVGCYMAHIGDNPGIKSCTVDCVTMMLPSALSTSCSDCYTADVLCTAMSCAAQCITNPAGTACVTCRTTAGCLPGFYACSGLPIPGGASGAAGASN